MRLFWCTKAFYKSVGHVESAQDLMGKTLRDMLPKPAAEEREKTIHEVIRSGVPTSHCQFSADTRVITTIFPLDEQAFGHKGVLAVFQVAPVDAQLDVEDEILVLSTPNLNQLDVLTARELEVLHHVAQGMSTGEIAKHLSRSPKTIENHINSTHTKLGTHSRSQLVRYACERGIQSFTDAQWTSIIQGSKIVRKQALPKHVATTE